MRFDLDFSPFACVFLMLLVLLFQWICCGGKSAPAGPKLPRPKREFKPFAGLTRRPDCELCEQHGQSQPQTPSTPPPRLRFTRGRRRHIETTGHFCPYPACAYHGRVDWGNIRANGHPSGRRWRQLVCLSCNRHFLETHGTPFHAKQVEPDKLVWAIAALAEGLGIRAVARVFESDPNTVLGWLVEAAEHVEAFSRYHLHDLHVEQVQMDELFALLSAVKEGEVTEALAIKCLSRSPHWPSSREQRKIYGKTPVRYVAAVTRPRLPPPADQNGRCALPGWLAMLGVGKELCSCATHMTCLLCCSPIPRATGSCFCCR